MFFVCRCGGCGWDDVDFLHRICLALAIIWKLCCSSFYSLYRDENGVPLHSRIDQSATLAPTAHQTGSHYRWGKRFRIALMLDDLLSRIWVCLFTNTNGNGDDNKRWRIYCTLHLQRSGIHRILIDRENTGNGRTHAPFASLSFSLTHSFL